MPLETIDKEIIENTEKVVEWDEFYLAQLYQELFLQSQFYEKTENPILAAMKITVSIPEDKWKNLPPSDKMRLLCARKEYLKST